MFFNKGVSFICAAISVIIFVACCHNAAAQTKPSPVDAIKGMMDQVKLTFMNQTYFTKENMGKALDEIKKSDLNVYFGRMYAVMLRHVSNYATNLRAVQERSAACFNKEKALIPQELYQNVSACFASKMDEIKTMIGTTFAETDMSNVKDAINEMGECEAMECVRQSGTKLGKELRDVLGKLQGSNINTSDYVLSLQSLFTECVKAQGVSSPQVLAAGKRITKCIARAS